jgi:hypothetical protein
MSLLSRSSQVTERKKNNTHKRHQLGEFFYVKKLHTYYVKNIVSCKNEINDKPGFDIACLFCHTHAAAAKKNIYQHLSPYSSSCALGGSAQTFYVHVKSFIDSLEFDIFALICPGGKFRSRIVFLLKNKIFLMLFQHKNNKTFCTYKHSLALRRVHHIF